MLGSGGTIAWSPADVPSCATTRASVARRWHGVRPAVRSRLTVSVGERRLIEARIGGRCRPHTLLLSCNSRSPTVVSRTLGALLLSCTQASVAEYRRQTLAPDDQQKRGTPRRDEGGA
jgi:hypothetical protein